MILRRVCLAALCGAMAACPALLRAEPIDDAAFAMPVALYENGDFREALASCAEKLPGFPEGGLAYTVCAEVAMASAAQIGQLDKAMAYAAMAEPGLAQHGKNVDATLQRVDATRTAVERSSAFAPDAKAQHLARLTAYRDRVKAIYDTQSAKRTAKKWQYRIEYALAFVLLLGGIFLH